MRARAETIGLTLLAALPLLLYVVAVRSEGVPRFAMNGDYAGLILATKSVWTGKVLLGPYSRFGFSHPGPFYFFLLWPSWALCGGQDVGLFVGACAINIVAAMAVVGAARTAGGRTHAIAGLVVLWAWESGFGPLAVQPWNPLVIVLPLTAFFVLGAVLLQGETRAAAPFVALGAFVAETHVSTVPTVVVIGGVALGYRFIVGKRSGGLSQQSRLHYALTGIVLGIALLPMIVEQFAPRGGNLGALIRFFLHRPEPSKPLGEAFKNWAYGMSWLPDQLFSCSLRNDGLPRMMSSFAMPDHLTPTALHWACGLVVAVVVSAFVAFRRRDRLSLALLMVSALAMIASLVSLRGVVAETSYYLVFWTTSASTVAFIGVLSTAFGVLDQLFAGQKRAVRHVWGFVGIALCGALFAHTAVLQRSWIAQNKIVPNVDAGARDVYAILRARLERDAATPIVHNVGYWYIALSHELEFSRDGFDVRVPERDQWILGRQFGDETGVARPLHVYVVPESAPVPFAACLEHLGKMWGANVYAAPRDVISCP